MDQRAQQNTLANSTKPESAEALVERHKREASELRERVESVIASDQRSIAASRAHIKANRALLASLPKPPVKRVKRNGKAEAKADGK